MKITGNNRNFAILKFNHAMKRVFLVILLIITSLSSFAQKDEIIKIIDKGEAEKAKALINQAFQTDTNTADYYDVMYHYYINANNQSNDSLQAYEYLLKYNNLSKQEKPTDNLAKALLIYVYSTKDEEKFNKYISLTQNKPELQKEAKRIRNQVVFEKVKQSKSLKEYKRFVSSYPDAMQVDEAKIWINDNTLKELINAGNIDSLIAFANSTTSASYKQKALSEVDKLSFRKALKENSVDSYVAYLKEFPNGDYVKMAKTNMEKAQYEYYVAQGKITDMLYYLSQNDSTDKNYDEVFARLSLQAMEHYSILAMKRIQEINPNEKLLKRFAKRYCSDLILEDIDTLLSYFPSMKEDPDIMAERSKAEQLWSLKNKEKLTMSDYTTHKNLFKNLDVKAARDIFLQFEQQNIATNKKKAVNFNLNNDYNYVQYKAAKNKEYNFVLTDNNEQALQQMHPNVRFISKADTNGYGYYEGSENRDIYVSVLENGEWSEEKCLPPPINSRFDECYAQLSPDGKQLWFSSNQSLNFGGLDIYVAFREDTTDWNNWSEPILLSEDFNTTDDDFVVNLTDNMLVVSQDKTFNKENNLYLEGNTHIDVINGKLSGYNEAKNNIIINILNKETLELISMTKANESGYYAFLKPEKAYVLSVNKKNYYTPLADTNIVMHSIQTMIDKQELVTIHSPFDNKGELRPLGKKELKLIADSFAQTNGMITIGINVFIPTNKLTEKELSEKQAKQVFDYLVANGISADRLVVKGYGNTNAVQGWEGVNSLDIGLINK